MAGSTAIQHYSGSNAVTVLLCAAEIAVISVNISLDNEAQCTTAKSKVKEKLKDSIRLFAKKTVPIRRRRGEPALPWKSRLCFK